MMWRLASIRSHSILRNNGRFSIHLTHSHSLSSNKRAPISAISVPMHIQNTNAIFNHFFFVHICLNPLLLDRLWMSVCVSLNIEWRRGWMENERRQIAYCRKINTICNSSREHFPIQSFSVITWRLNWYVYFYSCCSIELHSLPTWICDTSKYWHINVVLLENRLSFTLSISLVTRTNKSAADCSFFATMRKKWWKQLQSTYGNFMMIIFTIQTEFLMCQIL